MNRHAQSPLPVGNSYQDVVIRDNAVAQLGNNINGPVTVTGKLILINPRVSRIDWQAANNRVPQSSRRVRPLASNLVNSFLTCVERLEWLHLDETQHGPLSVSRNRLNNLAGRLTGWGWGCGLHSPQAYDSRLDTHRHSPEIGNTLQVIAAQLVKETLTSTYGLIYRDWTSQEAPGGFLSRLSMLAIERNVRTEVLETASATWRIANETKFSALLTCLRDFIEDLEAFTRDLHVSEQQRNYLNAGIESISDLSVLTDIETARVGENDPVSDAASIRITSLRNQASAQASISSASIDSLRELHIEDSAETEDASSVHGTFVTALSHQQDLVDESRRHLQENTNLTSALQVAQPHSVMKENSSLRHSLNLSISEERFSPEEVAAQRVKFMTVHAAQVKLTPKLSREDISKLPNGNPFKRIMKELLMTNEDPTTSMICAGLIEDNMRDILSVFFAQEGTPYQGGIFFIRWYYPEGYHFKMPTAKFLTRIYHPNIDAQGRICISTLYEYGWSPSLNLRTQLISISSLLDDPNVEDPLVPEIARQYQEDREEYNKIARAYTKRYATGDPPELDPYDENDPWWRGAMVDTN